MKLVELMVDHYEVEIVDPFIDAYNVDVQSMRKRRSGDSRCTPSEICGDRVGD